MNDERIDDYQELADSGPQVLAAQTLQRKADASPKVRATESLQTTADASPTAGTELPGGVRAKMERAFGADFSAVRVHEGPEASAVGARAYAQGTQIHFAPGQYQPHSQRGQEILGHELAHVVQQAEGRVQPTRQIHGRAVNDDPALEREADTRGREAARVPMAGAVTQKLEDSAVSTLSPAPTARVPIQRKDGDVEVEVDDAIDLTNPSEIQNLLSSTIHSGVPQGPDLDHLARSQTSLRGLKLKRITGGGNSKTVYIIENSSWILLTGLSEENIQGEVDLLQQLKEGYLVPEVHPTTFCVNRGRRPRYAYLLEYIPGFDIPKTRAVSFSDNEILRFGIRVALHLLGRDWKEEEGDDEWSKWNDVTPDDPVAPGRSDHQEKARENLTQIRATFDANGSGVPDFQVRYNSDTGQVLVLDASPTGQNPKGETLKTHKRWLETWLEAVNTPAKFLVEAREKLKQDKRRRDREAKNKREADKEKKPTYNWFRGY